ncbi:hypothetical protein PanWU01x14_072540 [Parasponia andersonii]|uniref:Uncharacterized protein n=1 Tax=Parasponia andersonii TaxID=3476 RepID=A0A2P5DDW1_PARAD|nr:hypothetical protein PanWU01x14_072540 [Parasponia andersonii]
MSLAIPTGSYRRGLDISEVPPVPRRPIAPAATPLSWAFFKKLSSALLTTAMASPLSSGSRNRPPFIGSD